MIRLHEARRSGAGDLGFTLVEVIVAMVVFGLVSTGILTSANIVIRMTADNRSREVAVNLAEQQLDTDRGILDPSRSTTSPPRRAVSRSRRPSPVAPTRSRRTPRSSASTAATSPAAARSRSTTAASRSRSTGPEAPDDRARPERHRDRPERTLNDSSTGSIAVLVSGASGAGEVRRLRRNRARLGRRDSAAQPAGRDRRRRLHLRARCRLPAPTVSRSARRIRRISSSGSRRTPSPTTSWSPPAHLAGHLHLRPDGDLPPHLRPGRLRDAPRSHGGDLPQHRSAIQHIDRIRRADLRLALPVPGRVRRHRGPGSAPELRHAVRRRGPRGVGCRTGRQGRDARERARAAAGRDRGDGHRADGSLHGACAAARQLLHHQRSARARRRTGSPAAPLPRPSPSPRSSRPERSATLALPYGTYQLYAGSGFGLLTSTVQGSSVSFPATTNNGLRTGVSPGGVLTLDPRPAS